MKQNKKILLAIIIGIVVCCAFVLLANKNTTMQEGEKQVIDIEAVDLTETVYDVQYAPYDDSIYFIYENEIRQYSLDDKAVAKKTDGIGSN